MADKKLNEVTKVTDMAYVPVILSDGSVGQIAKADLATVVAGLLRKTTAFSIEASSKTTLLSVAENSAGFIFIKDYAFSCVYLWIHSSTSSGSIIAHIGGSQRHVLSIEGTTIYDKVDNTRHDASYSIWRMV